MSIFSFVDSTKFLASEKLKKAIEEKRVKRVFFREIGKEGFLALIDPDHKNSASHYAVVPRNWSMVHALGKEAVEARWYGGDEGGKFVSHDTENFRRIRAIKRDELSEIFQA